MMYAIPLNKKGRGRGVGEQHAVIYDMKSRVVSLDYYYRFFFKFFKTIVVNAKGSDFYSHSENVWFSCLITSYCI